MLWATTWIKAVTVFLSLSFPVHYHFDKTDDADLVYPPTIRSQTVFLKSEEEFLSSYYLWEVVYRYLSWVPDSLSFNPHAIQDYYEELQSRFGESLSEIDLADQKEMLADTLSELSASFYELLIICCDHMCMFCHLPIYLLSVDLLDCLENPDATCLSLVCWGIGFLFGLLTVVEISMILRGLHVFDRIRELFRFNLSGTRHVAQMDVSDSPSVSTSASEADDLARRVPIKHKLDASIHLVDITNSILDKQVHAPISNDGKQVHAPINNDGKQAELHFQDDDVPLRRKSSKRTRSFMNAEHVEPIPNDGVVLMARSESCDSASTRAQRGSSFTAEHLNFSVDDLPDFESTRLDASIGLGLPTDDSIYLPEEEPGSRSFVRLPFKPGDMRSYDLSGSEYEPDPKRLRTFLHKKSEEVVSHGIDPSYLIEEQESLDSSLFMMARHGLAIDSTLSTLRHSIRMRSFLGTHRAYQ